MTDTLTRNWRDVLDALETYLARNLTPEEVEELAEFVARWGDE